MEPHLSANNWIKAEQGSAPRSKTQIFTLSVPPIRHLTQASWTLPSEDRQKKTRRITVPWWLEQKPHCGKLIRMKRQKVMSQNKGQGKTPERQLNEVEIVILPEKEFRIMIVKMMQDLGKTKEKSKKCSPKPWKS